MSTIVRSAHIIEERGGRDNLLYTFMTPSSHPVAKRVITKQTLNTVDPLNKDTPEMRGHLNNQTPLLAQRCPDNRAGVEKFHCSNNNGLSNYSRDCFAPPEQNPEVNDNYTFDDLSFTDDEFKRFPSIT